MRLLPRLLCSVLLAGVLLPPAAVARDRGDRAPDAERREDRRDDPQADRRTDTREEQKARRRQELRQHRDEVREERRQEQDARRNREPRSDRRRITAERAARAARDQNGGGRVLSVNPDGSGYRVRLLKDGEVRSYWIPAE